MRIMDLDNQNLIKLLAMVIWFFKRKSKNFHYLDPYTSSSSSPSSLSINLKTLFLVRLFFNSNEKY